MKNVKTFLVSLAVLGLSVMSSATMFAQTTVVYVGGSDNGKATVWHNGTPTYLAENGEIHSVVVANGDVYAAGNENIQGESVAKVWKNGEELYPLTDGTTAVNVISLAVLGSDVYVAGIEDDVAKVWLNGVAETTGYTDAYRLNSIFIDGNDVYVAGMTTTYDATVWKNGILYYPVSSDATAEAIFVFNSDVYTAGYDWSTGKNIGKIWKNNNEILSTLGIGNYAQSLYISEGVIYAAGYNENTAVAKLWIDGIVTDLTDGNYTNSVFVFNGDVYVAGRDGYQAMLWINEEATILATGSNSRANSVFVVEVYTVTFSGEEITIAPQYVEVGGNHAIAPETPEREGYDFAGWFTDNGTFANEWDFETNIVTQDTTLYAKWNIKTYTVTFAGEAISGIPTQSIDYGNLIICPEDPERENYDFIGWFTDNGTFANEWDFENYVVTQDTTLYAKWEEITGITDIAAENLKIYPNPTGDILNFSIAIPFELIDLQGKIVLKSDKAVKSVNINSLPSGIYFVKLKTETGEMIKKVMKE